MLFASCFYVLSDFRSYLFMDFSTRHTCVWFKKKMYIHKEVYNTCVAPAYEALDLLWFFYTKHVVVYIFLQISHNQLRSRMSNGQSTYVPGLNSKPSWYRLHQVRDSSTEKRVFFCTSDWHSAMESFAEHQLSAASSWRKEQKYADGPFTGPQIGVGWGGVW